jgi:hypothetical protein
VVRTYSGFAESAGHWLLFGGRPKYDPHTGFREVLGRRQRLSLAVALANQPAVCLPAFSAHTVHRKEA